MTASPSADVDPFDELRADQSDVITVAQAVEHIGRLVMRREVRAGRWQQPHRRTLVCHNGTLTTEQRLWVAVLAGPPGTVLAGPTAAEAFGLRGFESEMTHVVIPGSARRHDMPFVSVHRSIKLGPKDVHPILEPRRTRLPRSLLDMVSWAPSDDQAQMVIAAAVQQRLLTGELLEEAVVRRGRFARSALVAETIRDVIDGSHSLPELDFIRIVRRRGLPEPERQRVLRRPDGRRYLDADWPLYGVSAEVHGIPHMAVRQWAADLDRINDITADGRRVLQFSSYAVRRKPDTVGEPLDRALRAGGWRP